MIIMMDSKTFFDHYLVDEDKEVIENANYVIASARIKSHGQRDNIITAHQSLFPHSEVFNCEAESDMKVAYFKQLEEYAAAFLAAIIKTVVTKNVLVIIINTKKENRTISYLEWLQEYIYQKFRYPTYFYDAYCEGAKIEKYKPEKVVKMCDKILEKESKKQEKQMAKTQEGKEKLLDKAREMKKSDLKKLLKKRDIYVDDSYSKKELIDIYEMIL